MALWTGTTSYATKKQLTSSISGFYTTLSNYDFSTISLSTLIIPDWISTSALYVSDIKGANIDIGGITIGSNGEINAPIVAISSLNMKGFDSLLDVDVSFDFGLGKAIGGVVGGLGALVGGGLIAVGTGAGLAIQAAATGAATLIAGRPQNFISQTNYETINFTTQLQVSTLGYASPVYSSIFRTVSSISPNQIPGREIFTSTLFYPGQICVRSASDPFNLMSGDSNMNTSTIQSFGQWTALEGLEPENIVANSISTNFISSGLIDSYITTGFVTSTFVGEFNTGQFKTLGVDTQISMDYDAPISFSLGVGDFGRILGSVDYLWQQSDQDIIFSKIGNTGTVPIAAQLSMGFNAYESYFQVSSILSRGEVKANTGYFSSLTAETINAISTFFITSTNVEFITSTQIINADLGIFSSINLSTIQQLGLTSIYNYPGAITAINTATNTTSPVVGIGFKAQVSLNNNNQPRTDYNYNGMTGTFNGSNFFPAVTLTSGDAIPWSFSNMSKGYISTLYVNTISSSSVFAQDISSNTLEVNGTINNENGLLISQEGIFSTILTINGESLNYAAINTNYQSNFFPASMLSSPITSVSTTVLSAYYELDAINTPITISPGANNDMTLTALGAYLVNGVMASCNYYGRDLIIDPIDNTFKVYTDNNGFGLSSNLPVVNLSNSSAFFFGLYINAPSAAMTIPAGGSVGVYWNNTGNTFVSTPYYSWPVSAQSNESLIKQNYTGLTIDTPSLTVTSNITIEGTLGTIAPSYGRVGIEVVTFTDATLSWTNVGGAIYESAAQNPIPRPAGGFYSTTEWTPVVNAQQVITPSGTTALITFAFKPTANAGYWDVYRYVRIENGSPVLGEVDYTCLMIPNNFIV